MTRTIVDIHILQTVPPSNLNRDDTGSPKTAVYGGVRRARVSSQAWKRAVRVAFATLLDGSQLGERTKRVGESLAGRIVTAEPEFADRAVELAASALKAAGLIKDKAKPAKGKQEPAAVESEYLLFLSSRQLDLLAENAVAAARAGEEPDAKLFKTLVNAEHSVDIALFGRMVADLSDINVDAAAQVAHAISVHAVDNEFDYFTAVDDRKEKASEQGAGMIGTVEFNSSTLYRYATVDVDRLHDNLGNAEATRRAVEAFVTAFATSMPSGKQNTFANRTLPDAVVVRLRDSQPINFVGAFEDAVQDSEQSGRIQRSAARLATYAADIERTYGEEPVRSWVSRVGDRTADLAVMGEDTAFKDLVVGLGDEVALRLAKS
ncbi:type I-E CRISPR-associated protein Cas7/Cse4/CasC [Longispora sp. K20-0274]|uniref:type I-E CRISPR-associated protein Cas7/Cse4/CasC n=1 Tax=Longispora sp. K20-0274 TaxID=3088255 RepID=UPI00399B1C58